MSLSADEVRKVARLSRLALSDAQVEQYRAQLAAVLGYVERLREVDVAGVEPLTNVGDAVNRLDEDVPGPVIANEVLMRLAPDVLAPFVKVPKVLEEGGGA